MAVFLAGGNEGPGKLCCSEQRDNSSHSPVLTSRQCAGRSHVHVDEWILLQVRVFTIEHVFFLCMKLKEIFNSTYVCTYVSNFNSKRGTLQYKLARVHGCAIGILPEVVGYFL